MVRREAAGMNCLQLSGDLESRGISIDASDGGDSTRLSGSCPTEQLEHAFTRAGQILLQPNFDADDFIKLKRQSMAGLMQALSSPTTVAGRELNKAQYGDSALGRQSTLRRAGRAYDIRSDQKLAGMLAGKILYAGIDSRLGKYVRAEKGYTYGATGIFQPARHAGIFEGSVDTNPDTTAPCIEAMFK